MAERKLLNVTVIPAEPGYKLLWRNLIEPDTKAEDLLHTCLFSPILGWRVETYEGVSGRVYSFVEALTLDGVAESDHAIIFPDGSVEVPDTTTLKNIEEYIDYVKAEDNGRNA